MTRNIEGTIEEILDKQAANGPYRLVRIDGEGYFDFDGMAANAKVKGGDTVRLRATEGQWPKIRKIHRIGEPEPHAGRVPSDQPNGKDAQIVRMSCLRSAAELLAATNEPPEAKRDKALALAEEMVAWVNNGHSKET